MDRRSKTIMVLFGAVLLTIIVIEIIRPQPLDWRPSYTANAKVPFGCFVLFGELSQLFPDTPITKVESSLYDVLGKSDSTSISNYMIINDQVNLDEQEGVKLLDYVHRGNTAFIAATDFGSRLSDTLKIKVKSINNVTEDTVSLTVYQAISKDKKYPFWRGQQKTHFTELDTLATTVLGSISFTENQKNFISSGSLKEEQAPNFIKIAFGAGHFYLHTAPQAFANYYLLMGNQDYAAQALSFLENRPLFWDNYKKSGRIIVDSPMRFVLNQISLKWAYYLSMVGLLLFVVFKGKREQRIIPVIEPLANTSVEFAKTVGALYYQHKDYTNLIDKKLLHFKAFVRQNYFINFNTLSDITAVHLAAKSGKSISEAKSLLDYIIRIQQQKTHTAQDLVQLHKKITTFKK